MFDDAPSRVDLRGASKKQDRRALLARAQKEREERELQRKRLRAAVTIQACTRAHLDLKRARAAARGSFDAALAEPFAPRAVALMRALLFFFNESTDAMRLHQLLALLRTGEVKAAMAWDAGGWKLNAENPDIRFVAPESGALGWIDTFAIPRRSENEEAAYKWINFVMQPEIAARITNASGNFTASKGADEFVKADLRDAYRESFDDAAINNIKWYPPVPPGLETMEGQVLDRVQAAN